jgi:NAD(P)H dehydrogenase (quinone)
MTISHTPNIAILGATGLTGRALIDHLATRGCRPVAITRNVDKAGSFGDRATPRAGDLADRASLTAALAGIEVAHLIPPVFDDREEDYAANLIAAAIDAGVRRITYHSVLHAPTPAMPHHRRKSMVELMLRESPLQWTNLQPAMYMQTPLSFYDREAGTFAPTFDPAKPFNPIDMTDLIEATASILLQPGHEFATYELAGAERLDCRDMAEILTAVSGETVTLGSNDPEAFARRRGAGRGFDTRQIQELLMMYRHYDDHGLVGNGNVLTMILGRLPRDFAYAVRQALA